MPRKARRLSDEAARVLSLFLDTQGREWYGLEIVRLAEIKSGSLYPILHRFAARGFVTARWETGGDAGEHRRPRRLYRLDLANVEEAAAAYAEWAARRKPAGRQPETRPGRRLGEAT